MLRPSGKSRPTRTAFRPPAVLAETTSTSARSVPFAVRTNFSGRSRDPRRRLRPARSSSPSILVRKTRLVRLDRTSLLFRTRSSLSKPWSVVTRRARSATAESGRASIPSTGSPSSTSATRLRFQHPGNPRCAAGTRAPPFGSHSRCSCAYQVNQRDVGIGYTRSRGTCSSETGRVRCSATKGEMSSIE